MHLAGQHLAVQVMSQGFGSSEEVELLHGDIFHLKKWEKSIFASRLANLVRRALKQPEEKM